MQEKFFIGGKEIKSLDGNLVTFLDGTTRTLTARNTYLVTDKEMDATALQALTLKEVESDFIAFIKSADYTNSEEENIEKLANGLFEIVVSHDIEIGTRRSMDSTLDALVLSFIMTHSYAMQQALTRLSHMADDSFDVCISKKFDFNTNESRTKQARHLRISQLLT